MAMLPISFKHVERYTGRMPARVSAAVDLERTSLTAEDFLEWLEPGRRADLIEA